VVFIESNRSPGTTHIDGIPVIVIPIIDCLHQFLKPDDVIWVRGGFRSWFVHLEELKKAGHWLLLYAANTGRQRWPIWDVVFDDYATENRLDSHGRLWAKFNKPVNPEIFKFTDSRVIYDVCVGGSHIHDRKGQWRTIEALWHYKQARNRNLKAIMPGRPIKGSQTMQIPQKIESWGLDVAVPGMLPRPQMCKIYNQSKIFVYLGEHGQNDRGPLEALSCGACVIVANPRKHQPEVYNHRFGRVVSNVDYDQVTNAIDYFLNVPPERKAVVQHYDQVNGAKSVVLPKIQSIFRAIQEIGKPNTTELFKRIQYRDGTN
jgi:glycosyltransferase involved in cell wall biosynthesis